jgi:hypothetical protein
MTYVSRGRGDLGALGAEHVPRDAGLTGDEPAVTEQHERPVHGRLTHAVLVGERLRRRQLVARRPLARADAPLEIVRDLSEALRPIVFSQSGGEIRSHPTLR